MVLRLAEVLDIPIRDRNDLLEGAGLAPLFSSHALSDEAMAPFLKAIQYSLEVSNPLPAFALNRHYDIIDSNQAAKKFFGWNESSGPMNQIEMMYGSPMIRQFVDNWESVAWAMVYRLRREAALAPTGDRLRSLVDFANKQLIDIPHPDWDPDEELVICPHYHVEGGLVRTIDMISRFGITREITADELRVRTIYPRDAEAEAFFFGRADRPTQVSP
jgi:hypothetical protein